MYALLASGARADEELAVDPIATDDDGADEAGNTALHYATRYCLVQAPGATLDWPHGFIYSLCWS